MDLVNCQWNRARLDIRALADVPLATLRHVLDQFLKVSGATHQFCLPDYWFHEATIHTPCVVNAADTRAYKTMQSVVSPYPKSTWTRLPRNRWSSIELRFSSTTANISNGAAIIWTPINSSIRSWFCPLCTSWNSTSASDPSTPFGGIAFHCWDESLCFKHFTSLPR